MNVDLNNKWWIELIKIINYLRNRFLMTNKLIILYEIDTKRKSFFAHLCRIETKNYVMKRKSITKWKKLVFKIVFRRARKILEESHLLNVTSQRNHLSCLVCHMNLWHYVKIENVESVDSVLTSINFEKFRKIKINNFKIVTIMKNRLKCNDKNFLKDEINAKNAWKISKNSFSSFESKMLNDLLIKLWIIIFVNNQNVTNYVQRFKMTMQNIRKMIINVSINDNLFILYFYLNLDAKFKQYREHYVQSHEIVLNESNSIKDINYAINRFLNICVNRSISKKSTLVMIVLIFVLNSFFDKIQLKTQLKIKNVVIIIVKMCIICEKKYYTTNEHREQFNLKRNRDQFDEKRDD